MRPKTGRVLIDSGEMEQVLIGFGSNQGDSVAICRGAVRALRQEPRLRVDRVSSLYRTQPVGITEQAWFINGVLQGETDLEPAALLAVIRRIEQQFGRVRQQRWGPRTLDLDILCFGQREIRLPQLTIPHPRMQERRFVLLPLLEIAPHWLHPTLKMSVDQLLAALSEQELQQQVQRLESE